MILKGAELRKVFLRIAIYCNPATSCNPIPLSSGIISKAPPVWPPYPDAPPKAVKKTKASAQSHQESQEAEGWSFVSFECLRGDFGCEMSRVSTCTDYYD